MTDRILPRILVQTATRLAGPWTTLVGARALRDKRGSGDTYGDATFVCDWGTVSEVDVTGAPATRDRQVPRPGTLVRLVSTFDDGVTTTPEWRGYVASSSESPIDGTATVSCRDLRSLLAQIYIQRGWELARDGSVINPGHCPPCNALTGGDRSATMPADGLSYVHDRGASGTTARGSWMAADTSQMLLRRAARGMDDAPADSPLPALTFALGTVPAAVDRVHPLLDPNGRTVADCLNELWDPRYGCTWTDRCDDEAGIVYIDVIDLTTYTDLDLSASRVVGSPAVELAAEAYDVITVAAAQPVVGITLRWGRGDDANSALIPDGWEPGTTADSALLEAATVLDGPSGPQPYQGKTWRAWKLNPAWNGQGHGVAMGGSSAVVLADGLRSLIADDGTRTWQQLCPSPTTLALSQSTPWDAQGGSDATGPRLSAFAVAGATGYWQHLSRYGGTVSVVGGIPPGGTAAVPAGITIGNSVDAAMTIRDLVDASGELLVTLGVTEWAPLTVRWRRRAEDWPVPGIPRCLMRCVNGAELHRGCAGAMIGCLNGGLTSAGAAIVVRDDTPKLKRLLERLVAWYGTAHGRGSIVITGVITAEDLDLSPGYPTGTLVFADGTESTLNAPVTSLSRDYVAGRTTVEWNPVQPDLMSLN
jgi:hypothetical protein